VHLGDIHLWKIRRQQWQPTRSGFSWQSQQGRILFILSVCAKNEKPGRKICAQDIDEEDSTSYIGFT